MKSESQPTRFPIKKKEIILLDLFTFGALLTGQNNAAVYQNSKYKVLFFVLTSTTPYLDPPLPWVPPPHRLNMAPQPCTEVAAMTKVRANTRCLILTSPSCSRH